MTTGISAALGLFLLAMTSLAFDVKEIVPGRKVAAQIGKELVLSCRTSGCEGAPTFLWSAQLDNPLGGTVHEEGSNSFLTMKPVTFANAHQYTCTATCGEDKRQKKVRVDVYSFLDNPVIEVISPLILGKQAEVTCSVPNVYPSDRLEVSLKIGEKLIGESEFFDEPVTQSLQTKSLRAFFTPTKGDIGKDITCIAELPIDDMEFEPKKRQTTHRLNIAVFSSTTPPSKISSSTTPPATISSSTTPLSTVSTSTTQPSTISSSTTPPSTISTSTTTSSTISTSTTQPSTISSSTTPLSTISPSTTQPSTISSSTTPPSTISTSTYQPEHITEKEDFTIPSTPYSAPHQKEDETSAAAEGTNFMYRTLQNDTTYAVSVVDDITSGTEEVIIIARKEELDYLMTGVIAAASLVTVAGPVAAILLYISRKTKINGSYSLVNSPEAKV
ncbi:hypothetical protein lerEdw1_020085 [Lerista edwardsae]|nr:hypothetical protein lerEdw1_020085 [Lerista edwardsae]